ncbi:MAG: hydantoinase/oxoprolinase family protein [Alphaproteobacteria bacterium]
MAKIGVDVGGTFTDLILESGEGPGRKVFVHKVPSTPHDQSEGVLKGVLELCEIGGIAPAEVSLIVHGTTIATNTVLEYDGAEVGMLTTRGFRDILHTARHKRPHNFSMQFDVPWQSKPLVKRRNRIPITERILPPSGEIVTPLAEDEVREAAALLKSRGVEAVIICFLFSFLNNAHEKRAKAIVREALPGLYVAGSHEVVDVIREYERFSTTAMNAFVGPRAARYLKRLEAALRAEGIGAQIRVMQSNGGVTNLDNAAEHAATILMSGPAGGVIGGRWAAEMSGERNAITVDIGGTSADISVIPDGRLRVMNPRDTQVNGYPVLAPMLDIDTIGAGGGSIAYMDEGGAFRVGPRSAGADPGPACYGRGGEEPTVTDAQVVLGRLDPEHFLGGGLKIDPALARKAIETKLCPRLGVSVIEAALGIIRVVNSNMALSIRANSVAKGIDPRRYALMPFGGAGPLHGTALAKTVSAKEVIVPPAPGIHAAIGLLATDMQYEFTRSSLAVLTQADQAALDRINGRLDELMAQANAALEADGVPAAQRHFTRIAECRYVGQGFELRAALPAETLTLDNRKVVIDNFHKEHRQVYGHAFEEQDVELITLRVVARVPEEPVAWPRLPDANGADPEEAVLFTRRTVFDDGAAHETPRYARAKLKAGQTIDGPAVVVQTDSTTLIPPGWLASIHPSGNLHVRERT